MGYKTYNDQFMEHFHFLRSKGFDIKTLEVDHLSIQVRCHAQGTPHYGRGELAYRCTTRKLNNGLLGIVTWFRGLGGEEGYWTSYGHWPADYYERVDLRHVAPVFDGPTAGRVLRFWSECSPCGKSDYLERKQVGSYGIRFRPSIQYGNVAVVPMYDAQGQLRSYQLLNPDGSKRFAKGINTKGLFHALRPLVDNMPIGLAESYVTASTCMELANIPVVCAFSSNNLGYVAETVRRQYPKNFIVIFADDDLHLDYNKGRRRAYETAECDLKGKNCTIFLPDFGDTPPSRQASDWNDLVRLKGKSVAKRQFAELRQIILPLCLEGGV